MLNINIEFSKGVLFVRLSGLINSLNQKNIKSNIITILKEGGIKYLVFNIDDLIIEENVDLFDRCNELVKSNDGKMIICGNKVLNEIKVSNYDNAKDELSALRMIESC